MVSDVRLAPQGTPQGNTTATPVIRPTDTQAPSLRNVPRVSADGFMQAQRAYATIGAQAERMNAKIVGIAQSRAAEREKKRREQEAEQKELEDKINRQLEAEAELSQMNIELGNYAAVQQSLGDNLNRIVTEGGGDPTYIGEAYSVIVDEHTNDMPPDVARLTKTTAAARANPVLEHARARKAQEAAIEAQGDQAQYQDFLQEEAVQYANPTTPSQETARDSAIAQFNALIDARTDLVPAEKELRKQKLFEDMHVRVGLDYVLDSPRPAASAVNVALGNTGIPEIDSMPSTERIKVFSQAQGIVNYFQAERSRAQAQAEKRQAAYDAELMRRAHAAAVEDPALAYNLADQIIATASTPKAVQQGYALKEALEDAHNKRFVESDPAVRGAMMMAVQTGAVGVDTLRETTVELFGKGLSADDTAEILGSIDARQEGFFTSPAYKNVMLKAETVFPDVFFPKDGGSLMELLVNPEKFAAAQSPEGKAQQQQFLGFVTELNDRILDGEFQTEQEMRDWSTRELQGYSSTNQTNLPPRDNSTQTDVRNFDATHLEPKAREAYTEALGDAGAVREVNRRYINKPELILEDWKAGRINDLQAAQYQALVRPKVEAR